MARSVLINVLLPIVGVGFLIGAIYSMRNSPIFGQPPISEDVLSGLLRDLDNPRIMTLNSLPSERARKAFKQYGFSFWLKGNFDGDNRPDVAIAGRFDNPGSPEDQTFVLIVTLRNGEWSKTFFFRPKSRVVMLKTLPHPDSEKSEKGYVGVAAQFTEEPSDDFALIYGDGKSYQVLGGFDLTPQDLPSLP